MSRGEKTIYRENTEKIVLANKSFLIVTSLQTRIQILMQYEVPELSIVPPYSNVDAL